MTYPPDVKFKYLSFSTHAPEDWRDAYLLLDTNVVAAMDAMAQRGYRGDHPADVKVVALLKKIRTSKIDGIHHALDMLEGGGFHRGGFEVYNAIHRFTAVRGLLELAEKDLEDFIRSGESLSNAAFYGRDQKIIKDNLDQLMHVFPWIFLPCYAVTLALHVAATREGGILVETLIDNLADVPFMPDAPVIGALLTVYGEPNLRGRVRDGLFRMGERNIPKIVQSATWDLAYVEFLELMCEVPVDGKMREPHQYVFVTDDGALSDFVTALHFSSLPGPMKISARALHKNSRSDFHHARRTIQEHPARNAMKAKHSAIMQMESGDVTAVMQQTYGLSIRRLEIELGLEPLNLAVWPPQYQAIPSDWGWVAGLLPLILGENRPTLDFLYASVHEHDVLMALLPLVNLVATDNANARDRSVEDTLASLTRFRNEDGPLGDAYRLVLLSCANGDNSLLLTTLLKHIHMTSNVFGIVVMGIIVLVQELVRDTAKAECVEGERIIMKLHKIVQELDRNEGYLSVAPEQ